MPVDLSGRVAVVTGASRGIGHEIAADLVAAGASVIITARNSDALADAAAQIGERCVPFGAHVGDPSAAEKCFELALERWGRVDILVNNAATNPAYGPAIGVERRAFDKTIEVNLWAPLMWTQAAWRSWMHSHGGAVVNVSSLGALVTDRDTSVYAASKAALLHMTRHLALELAPLVRVNAVAPGLVRTDLSSALVEAHGADLEKVVPLGRLGRPRDVASAVTFLASDDAVWITGTTIVIDGGARLETVHNLISGPSAADADRHVPRDKGPHLL